MSKSTRNTGKPWTPADDRALQKMADPEHADPRHAFKLGRTEAAVRPHAQQEDVSLKPTNQSPYNRRKK